MLPLAPLDAIGPALSRTRELLFTDFRLGRFLKVALVAAIAEGTGVSGFNFSGPMQTHTGRTGGGAHMPTLTPEQIHFMLAAAVVVGVVLIPLFLLFLYLSSRFTFVNFDMVLLKRPFVRPGWDALRSAGNRYFLLRIALGVAGLAALAGCVVAVIPGFRDGLHGNGWGHLFSTLVMVVPLFLVFAIAMMLFQCFVTTFVVPRMALENAPVMDAIEMGWNSQRPSFGTFLLYFIARGAISLVIIFALMIALLICMAILGVAFAGIGFLAYRLLWGGGVVVKALVVITWVLMGASLLAGYVVAVIGIAGFRNVFRQAYALLFYGGYYPPLGNMLVPVPAPQPSYPAATAGTPPSEMPGNLPPQTTW